MGAYLDKPITEKDTEDGAMDLNGYKKLPYAVSSMQGWRKTMEDSHIAMPNLETSYDVPTGTCLYAVFDGHGGKEVALFCAKYFVPTLFDLESFKARAYREALVEAFHKIDEMLVDPKYAQELAVWSGRTGNATKPEDEVETNSDINSDMVREVMEDEADGLGSKKADSDSESSNHTKTEGEEDSEDTVDVSNSESKKISIDAESKITSVLKKQKLGQKDDVVVREFEDKVKEEVDTTKLPTKPSKEVEVLNKLEDQEENWSKAASDIGSEIEETGSKGSLTRSEAVNLMFKMLGLAGKPEGKPEIAEEVPEDAKSSTEQPRFTESFDLKLTTHAGATACVALIIEGKIYVANAGDSRAVLCRDKKAYPLSYDHKPNHEIEKSRIQKAGGWVTPFGRVCGNLNLSRCIGDLKYKQNSNIAMSKQIITAEPDIEVTDISDQDLFLVVACDGVWDILTNEGIVDFISKHLVDSAKKKAADSSLTINNTVEEVFNHCICDDPHMDGKGGDNMTALIVCLKPLDEVVTAFWA